MVYANPEALFYKRIRHYNVPGHIHFLTFSCRNRMPLLTNDRWRGYLAQAILEAKEECRCDLWAYVFMPEHVHLLVRPREDEYRIDVFLKMVKQPSARVILSEMERCNSTVLPQLLVNKPSRRPYHSFWLAGPGYDVNLWSWDRIIEKARYCHCNPVRRGMVKSPERWRWSSYRWLELGARDSEPLPLDEWNT